MRKSIDHFKLKCSMRASKQAARLAVANGHKIFETDIIALVKIECVL